MYGNNSQRHALKRCRTRGVMPLRLRTNIGHAQDRRLTPPFFYVDCTTSMRYGTVKLKKEICLKTYMSTLSLFVEVTRPL